MEKDLHTRIEEAAREYRLRNVKNPLAPKTIYTTKSNFIAGAEYGYKEALAQAKEWLGNVSWLADFEADMNKLWKK